MGGRISTAGPNPSDPIKGHCAETVVGGNCAVGLKGEWADIKSLRRCTDLCNTCARCNYISYSRKLRRCSWHAQCGTPLTDIPGQPPGAGLAFRTFRVKIGKRLDYEDESHKDMVGHGARKPMRKAKMMRTGSNPTSVWFETVAESLNSDPVLKQAYTLAATIALTNISRAQTVLRRAKHVNSFRNTVEMAIVDLDATGVSGRTFSQRGRTSDCRPNQDFLMELQLRQDRWRNKDHVRVKSLWQAAIDDKLIGFLYARSIGVNTPSVLWCDQRGIIALPLVWPKEWGCCFVIKPLHGYNDIGVMVVDHGVDVFTGWRLTGR